MSDYVIYTIGFLAQILFSSRLIIQWISSEKQKKVITPNLFWYFSLSASFLLFIYGYLRQDFAIMLGQSLTYFIYIRNLQLQNEWRKIPFLIRFLLFVLPVFIVVYYYNNNSIDIDLLFKNEDIPKALFWLGVISQIIFSIRFLYQWVYSEYHKKSSLSLGFWVISLIGSLLILIYAIIRRDPVLLVGHILGTVMYARNIVLISKQDVEKN